MQGWYYVVVDGDPVTVRSSSTTQFILLGVAIFFAVAIQLSILVRLNEIAHKSTCVFNLIATVCQFVAALGALLSFVLIPVADDVMARGTVRWGQGLAACLLSCCASAFVFRNFLMDWWRTRGENDDIGASRRKLLIANLWAVYVIAIGSTAFYYLEKDSGGWNFADASEFVIVTALTIGYGNVSPTTTASRLFLFVYFMVAAACIGYFISASEDYMVEKGEAEVIRMNEWRRIRSEERARKRLERKQHGLASPNPPPQQPTRPIDSFSTNVLMILFPGQFNPATGYKGKSFIRMAYEAVTGSRPASDANLAGSVNISVGETDVAPGAGIYFAKPTKPVGQDVTTVSTTTLGASISIDVVGGDASTAPAPDALEFWNGDREDEMEAEQSEDDGSTTTGEMVTVGGVSTRGEESTLTADLRMDEELQKRLERSKTIRVVVSLIGWWLIAAAIFSKIEPNWTYMDSVYFTFTTFTTIAIGSFAHVIGLLTEQLGAKVAKNATAVQARIERRRIRKQNGGRKYDISNLSLLSRTAARSLLPSGITGADAPATPTTPPKAPNLLPPPRVDSGGAAMTETPRRRTEGAAFLPAEAEADADDDGDDEGEMTAMERLMRRTTAFAREATIKDERRRRRREKRRMEDEVGGARARNGVLGGGASAVAAR
ncbi:Potassium channel [Irineochytrium annulatum]|nr:Potassium channel [Irineochytrium annulatum]